MNMEEFHEEFYVASQKFHNISNHTFKLTRSSIRVEETSKPFQIISSKKKRIEIQITKYGSLREETEFMLIFFVMMLISCNYVRVS